MYPITFKPLAMGEYEMIIQLNNPTTSEIWEYTLTGIADEPLAAEHIIIEAIARRDIISKISLKNPYDQSIT